jgi:hypothetical protein
VRRGAVGGAHRWTPGRGAPGVKDLRMPGRRSARNGWTDRARMSGQARRAQHHAGRLRPERRTMARPDLPGEHPRCARPRLRR